MPHIVVRNGLKRQGYTVVLCTEPHGREVYTYDTAHEADAAIRRLRDEAQNASDFDGVTRLVGFEITRDQRWEEH